MSKPGLSFGFGKAKTSPASAAPVESAEPVQPAPVAEPVASASPVQTLAQPVTSIGPVLDESVEELEIVDGAYCPIDPQERLQCDSCQ